MSIETYPKGISSPESQTDSELSSVEAMGEADGISYVVKIEGESTTKAVFAYRDIIDRINSALDEYGYNRTKAFDVTILNWLEHHCTTLPVDVIRIDSTVADWEGWDWPHAPWFEKFEEIQKEYDKVAELMAPGMPLGQRPEVEMLLDGQLIWSGHAAPYSA